MNMSSWGPSGPKVDIKRPQNSHGLSWYKLHKAGLRSIHGCTVFFFFWKVDLLKHRGKEFQCADYKIKQRRTQIDHPYAILGQINLSEGRRPSLVNRQPFRQKAERGRETCETRKIPAREFELKGLNLHEGTPLSVYPFLIGWKSPLSKSADALMSAPFLALFLAPLSASSSARSLESIPT